LWGGLSSRQPPFRRLWAVVFITTSARTIGKKNILADLHAVSLAVQSRLKGGCRLDSPPHKTTAPMGFKVLQI
jgi:hypothetical protein